MSICLNLFLNFISYYKNKIALESLLMKGDIYIVSDTLYYDSRGSQ